MKLNKMMVSLIAMVLSTAVLTGCGGGGGGGNHPTPSGSSGELYVDNTPPASS